MYSLSSQELEVLRGGNLWGFLDGLCGGVAAGGVLAYVIGVSTGPIGTVIVVGCGAYEVVRYITS